MILYQEEEGGGRNVEEDLHGRMDGSERSNCNYHYHHNEEGRKSVDGWKMVEDDEDERTEEEASFLSVGGAPIVQIGAPTHSPTATTPNNTTTTTTTIT
jgi:hypothetical protein